MMNSSGPAVGAMGWEKEELRDNIAEADIVEVVSDKTIDAVVLGFDVIILDGKALLEELP